ncbi:MAG: hypothetical protein KR126chlam4_00966 [Candidatus Anoxychlamydiales bacterium]|uniref:Uncharacterized protein n=1 Tax=marine sediment metagenome TaxID=412755 RepID=A0A0F9H487_9ZZZZ|nr:hypothetical protein [Candidatus Anoxychlamydiales bacterium]NGX41129.1 hypothetical protein [Candidatus Anoxychlamydiales bacterium]HEU63948.1 hypothetical protein [Chlamydiota bacterium]
MISLSCPTRTMLTSAMIGVPIAVVSSIGQMAAISNGFNPQEVIAKTAIVTSTVSLIAGFVFSSIIHAKAKECVDLEQDFKKDTKESNYSLINRATMCVGKSIATGAITAFFSTTISVLIGYGYL